MYKVLTGASLMDGTGAKPLEDAVVVIKGETIEAIGPQGQVAIPADVEVIDVSGKYIIPGLIDAHIHLELHGMADTFQENLVEDKLRTLRSAKEMEDTLRAGFTTVRNVGSCNGIDFAVKQSIEAGYFKGPRIITAGRAISMTCSGTEYFAGFYRIADGVDECRKAAREQLRDGADCLKLMATGAVMNPGGVPGAAQLNVDEIKAVVDEGLKLGRHTAAHAHGARGIINAVRGGCRSIEHGTMADEEAIGIMAETGTWLVPTISLHTLFEAHADEVPAFALEKSQAMQAAYVGVIGRALEAEVKVAMGTDAGTCYNYHGNNAAETICFVTLGLMSPLEALVATTKNAAEAIMMDHLVGTLEKGKLADLVVLEGDPLADIKILAEKDKIAMVFKGGELQF